MRLRTYFDAHIHRPCPRYLREASPQDAFYCIPNIPHITSADAAALKRSRKSVRQYALVIFVSYMADTMGVLTPTMLK